MENPTGNSRALFQRTKRLLVGHPLETDMASHERIPKWKALAVLSSDALSSVAYATEEVLIPLALLSLAATVWSLPIALVIAGLLLIVTLSYRQTIGAYPGGGGAYTVAKENLGLNAGLTAASALLIDYILTVAVSVSAGVANIGAAFPIIAAHKELAAVIVIIVVMLMNLRGVRESATLFALPTYFFIGSFLILIVSGVWKAATGVLPAAHPVFHETYPAIPLFLLLRAFSSGCSALTGIEAISNGVPIFKDPAQRNAKTTMVWMSLILGVFFLSITLLAHRAGIVPREGETVVSLLATAIFGNSAMYYIVQASTALILVLAANTSYADFPRLTSLLARDRFLPRQLASLGDRLVFSNGVIGLSLVSILLVIVFEGETHHLIPLYAVGVFLSFTLSQYGMVKHHLAAKRDPQGRDKSSFTSIFISALGGTVTFIVMVVIASTKFLSGAWLVIVAIPLCVVFFKAVHRHYDSTAKALAAAPKRSLGVLKHVAIVPVSAIHPGVTQALEYGKAISKDLRACTVDLNSDGLKEFAALWNGQFPEAKLSILKSPYRSVIQPVIEYIRVVANENRDEIVTVIIPEVITKRWYHAFLHNQTALFLYAALRTERNVVVTSVRYHL